MDNLYKALENYFNASSHLAKEAIVVIKECLSKYPQNEWVELEDISGINRPLGDVQEENGLLHVGTIVAICMKEDGSIVFNVVAKYKDVEELDETKEWPIDAITASEIADIAIYLEAMTNKE